VTKPPLKRPEQTEAEKARAAREAQALRENLRKRKQQMQARREPPKKDD